MKKCKNKCLVMLLAILLGGCFAGVGSDWDEFLAQPNERSLAVLESSIAIRAQQCNWGDPDNSSVVPLEKRKQLFELIAEGNESAFRVGLLTSKCLDGGELEDFNRNAGLFFERQPYTFLKIIKEKAVPESDIKNMLVMLPLDTVDNIDRAVYVVKSRINLLKGLGEDSPEEVKKVGLSFLKKELKALIRIKRDKES